MTITPGATELLLQKRARQNTTFALIMATPLGAGLFVLAALATFAGDILHGTLWLMDAYSIGWMMFHFVRRSLDGAMGIYR